MNEMSLTHQSDFSQNPGTV